MRKFIGYLFIALLPFTSFAQETCSRVAIVNYQEVLVDTNSTQKGEGLRFHLEKDEVAKKYLDQYQDGTKTRWQNAALGTLGTTMLIGGLVNKNEGFTKNSLAIGGVALIVVNFLMAKTYERSNEKNLARAIEEYNKRNLPRIYFGPEVENQRNSDGEGYKFFLNKEWSF
ncbi:hypothetical protein M899_0169 [Bacteriovorax sp. BSW11_IV]|uniref:hypothetical protein n=1 Tax=Bacteriovorax sp. BSW11_IV TaxID=1353529 RepID=UPI00038A2498|nr:hypothetical protein [Bacteriovorax sp. BSW11_IV]EQC47076.1 hypothetical protein M899_0169 [Bacteriovorax sp. BSW11_IV]